MVMPTSWESRPMVMVSVFRLLAIVSSIRRWASCRWDWRTYCKKLLLSGSSSTAVNSKLTNPI